MAALSWLYRKRSRSFVLSGFPSNKIDCSIRCSPSHCNGNSALRLTVSSSSSLYSYPDLLRIQRIDDCFLEKRTHSRVQPISQVDVGACASQVGLNGWSGLLCHVCDSVPCEIYLAPCVCVCVWFDVEAVAGDIGDSKSRFVRREFESRIKL